VGLESIFSLPNRVNLAFSLVSAFFTGFGGILAGYSLVWEREILTFSLRSLLFVMIAVGLLKLPMTLIWVGLEVSDGFLLGAVTWT
jgi:hypothetical protein